MEKGSFHTPPRVQTHSTSGQTTQVQRLDEMVSRIPLPNQLPKGIDFANIPAPALRSATLESLISQNEDLMARLSVSLRKGNQLEERTTTLERENNVLKGRIDAMAEHFLVLQEKDRMTASRAQMLHDEAGSAKSAAEKLEKHYADLYVQAQSFQRRLIHLERYRARIQKASPSVQERAKRLPALEDKIRAQMISHMQTVNSYDAKLAEARIQIEELRGKAQERDQIFEQKVRFENQLIHEQRQNQLTRVDSQREIDRLDQENASLRMQLKEALLTSEMRRQDLDRLQHEIPDLQEEQKALREQVESLQVLWAHKQREMDQLEEKNRNLQRLNQTLSASLNQGRKELQDLKQDMEKDEFSAQERLKTLGTEIEMLRFQLTTSAIEEPKS